MSSPNLNIEYKTDWLSEYFSAHRIQWDQFYPSERAIVESMSLGSNSSVLDVGCGCGGLGLALKERFGVTRYEGVEINVAAAMAARQMNSAAIVHDGDVLKISAQQLTGKRYDVVFSLSCIDWNVQFEDMLQVVWSHVLPGGHLVATFRLTDEPGCKDFDRSYQYMNADGVMQGERAAYVVSNAAELWEQLGQLGPESLRAHGYWGVPSATAVTPYSRLCFVALALRKRLPGSPSVPIDMQLQLPDDIVSTLGGGIR
jgi:SAM-dependent methyltransferase